MDSSANPFDEFDPQVRQDVEGLIHLGALSKEVEFCGHSFGLQTLNVGQELAAAKAAEDYRDTIKEPHAIITATIGMALNHVDGDEAFCPQAGPDLGAFARARFKYMANWYWPVHDHLYQEYVELQQRQLEAIRSIQDFSSRSLSTPSPSPDSLTVPGTLDDEMRSEIQATQSSTTP